MTGYRGIDEYIELDLVVVREPDKAPKYFAVVDDTADVMLGVDYARMNDPYLCRIKVEYLGKIQVQRLDGNRQ